jgi:hypothetical protein
MNESIGKTYDQIYANFSKIAICEQILKSLPESHVAFRPKPPDKGKNTMMTMIMQVLPITI